MRASEQRGMAYKLLANLILVVHLAFIGFVVLGLVAILVGGWLGWGWVRRPLFRLAHLAAIGLVVAQAWGGITCPLTWCENQLRVLAGYRGYAEGLIASWVRQLVFYDLPSWVFILGYTLFGLAVLTSFALVPPHWPRRAARSSAA